MITEHIHDTSQRGETSWKGLTRSLLILLGLAAAYQALQFWVIWSSLGSRPVKLLSSAQIAPQLGLVFAGIIFVHLRSTKLFELALRAARGSAGSPNDSSTEPTYRAKWPLMEKVVAVGCFMVLLCGLMLLSPSAALWLGSHRAEGISLLLCYAAFLGATSLAYLPIRRGYLVEQRTFERLAQGKGGDAAHDRRKSLPVYVDTAIFFPPPTLFAFFQVLLLVLAGMGLFVSSEVGAEPVLNEGPWFLNVILFYITMLMWWLLILRGITGFISRSLISQLQPETTGQPSE